MRRGLTCSRRSSPGLVPVLRPVAVQAPPGFCLADAGWGDWVICQVTSRPYGDPSAVPLDAADFASGGLLVASFARPGRLFTAGAGLMVKSVGVLSPPALGRVLSAVAALFRPPAGIRPRAAGVTLHYPGSSAGVGWVGIQPTNLTLRWTSSGNPEMLAYDDWWVSPSVAPERKGGRCQSHPSS